MLSSIVKLFNLKSSISSSFDELGIYKALNHANIYKRKGLEAKTVFSVIFALVFHPMSWSQLCKSKYADQLPKKDCIYRFLNSKKFNWRRFLLETASNATKLVEPLTDLNRIKAFIVDDSPYDRSRAKKTDLLSTIYDHVKHKYMKGFHLLTV